MGYFNQDKTCKFLLALGNTRGSILNIGREFYSCNNSIYDAIDKFQAWGLIEVIKGKRDLKVKILPKGKEVINAISITINY